MDANTLKGRAVVSLIEGTKLGSIEQPLFDLHLHRLLAFEMRGDDGIFFIPFGLVKSIGADAVTVASHQVVQNDLVDTLVELDQVMHLKVVDQAGTFAGTITQIDIDPATGEVVRITAHKGGVLGVGGTTTPIEPATILTVGPELLTLAADVGMSLVS